MNLLLLTISGMIGLMIIYLFAISTTESFRGWRGRGWGRGWGWRGRGWGWPWRWRARAWYPYYTEYPYVNEYVPYAYPESPN